MRKHRQAMVERANGVPGFPFRAGFAAIVALALAGALRVALAGAAETDGTVIVRDLVVTPASMRGSLSNLGDGELRDVRLLVTHSFLWNDEMNPGPDNPGRSEVYVVDGPIPPNGTLVFEEPLVPPLPPRADGRFESSVKVLGYTEVGP